MGQLDKNGILTLQELMITALATADLVAKLLIDKDHEGRVRHEAFFGTSKLPSAVAARGRKSD